MSILVPSLERVIADPATGRPLQIRSQGQRLAIRRLESVREETYAYPVISGPRTVFVVRAAGRRYRLVHLLRERRWTIEELGPAPEGLLAAA